MEGEGDLLAFTGDDWSATRFTKEERQKELRMKFWMDVFVANCRTDRASYAVKQADLALEYFESRVKKGKL